MAGYVILAPGQDARAAELGPSDVLADGSVEELYRAAGFETVVEYDTTRDFANTCERFLRSGEALLADLQAPSLRPHLEEELERKGRMYRGVSEGLLGRSLVVAS